MQKEVKEVELLQAQQRYFAHLTAVANNSSEVPQRLCS
jgi:hypothetical protein